MGKGAIAREPQAVSATTCTQRPVFEALHQQVRSET